MGGTMNLDFSDDQKLLKEQARNGSPMADNLDI